MSLDIFENHLDSAVCRDIIRRFEADKANQYQGQVATGLGAGHHGIDSCTKKCTEIQVSMLPHWADIDKIMFERMGDAIKRATAKHIGLELMGGHMVDEGYRIKRYMNDGNEGFKFHIDVNGFHTAHRQLICQWYLNTVEEGGETVFHEQDVSVKPVEGRLATFPPFWTHSHTANPPISEPKYIISGWLTFKKVPGPRRVERVIDHAARG